MMSTNFRFPVPAPVYATSTVRLNAVSFTRRADDIVTRGAARWRVTSMEEHGHSIDL